ncbi:MAG: DNA double-strand break repair nuclease NurA [Leptolyngbyaceae cyanobacterium SM1_1_3]|nr:DNA double-strand break repair nuclease NurA [Leptolyngbyaceae cyanobacterium SM1_1_3]NJM85690.1 DNA double-strand break repair nuclease NurA [Leptolyngbyaceae cyanobacterium RM2_2_21]NJN03765.1 DNA double-strand break repair nuclease NurA [Leptolyngbyaceae cyanobacterium RM1_1_2]
MLDLMKIAQQMQGISDHLTREAAAARLRIEKAEQLLHQIQPRQAERVAQLNQWRDRMIFTAAEPVESLATRATLAIAAAAHSVIATDGSQISPSHHEIAYCYLINVGRIGLHYGQGRHPLLDSLPEVIYRPEDLHVSRQWGIGPEEWMGYRRTVSEAVVLAELGKALSAEEVPAKIEEKTRTEEAEEAALTGQLSLLSAKAASKTLPPKLAMVDGSLIYWFLEPLPGEARDRILQPILDAWEQLYQERIPLVGYLSASRSGEGLNFLKLESCPYPEPNCLSYCAERSDPPPCQVFEPLRDVALWSTLLEPGQRSPLWRSSAEILSQYEHHTIYFCYVHVGSEVARVEMPRWVATDTALFESALSIVLAQVQKGYGYPVALAEAHNQAVVRGGDRARFFALLEQQMIRSGLRNVGTSYKEARKRGSIA